MTRLICSAENETVSSTPLPSLRGATFCDSFARSSSRTSLSNRPSATMSSTSGKDARPPGATELLYWSSGTPMTESSRMSPTPIRYSAATAGSAAITAAATRELNNFRYFILHPDAVRPIEDGHVVRDFFCGDAFLRGVAEVGRPIRDRTDEARLKTGRPIPTSVWRPTFL